MTALFDQIYDYPFAVVKPVLLNGFGRLDVKLRLPELGRTGDLPSVALVLHNQCSYNDSDRGDRFYAVRLEATTDDGGFTQVNLVRTGRAMTKVHRALQILEKAHSGPPDIVVTILRYLRAAKIEHVFVGRRINGDPRLPGMHHFTIEKGLIPDNLVSVLATHKVRLIQAVDGAVAEA